jgi:hypothetical protein
MTTRVAGLSLTIPWGAVALLSVLALFDAIFNYVSPDNGIHGTEGALLVVISTLLMAITAVLIGTRVARGWVGSLLSVLLVLDFLGTGLAAYLLDAWILLGLDVLAAIAWLATLAAPRSLSAAS